MIEEIHQLVQGQDFERIKALGKDIGRPEFESGAIAVEKALTDLAGQLARSIDSVDREPSAFKLEDELVISASRRASQAFTSLGHTLMKYTHFEAGLGGLATR